MNKTKPKVKRSEEYRIHLEQSLYYRRRCRSSYALFKELKQNGLLNVDEPFKSQIEEVIAQEPETEAQIRKRETDELKWNTKFQIYCDIYNRKISVNAENKEIVRLWINSQRTNYNKKRMNDKRLEKLRTVSEWNNWEEAMKARERLMTKIKTN